MWKQPRMETGMYITFIFFIFVLLRLLRKRSSHEPEDCEKNFYTCYYKSVMLVEENCVCFWFLSCIISFKKVKSCYSFVICNMIYLGVVVHFSNFCWQCTSKTSFFAYFLIADSQGIQTLQILYYRWLFCCRNA